MLNRLIAPPLLQPEDIRIPDAVIHKLPDDIPVIMVNAGTQEVVKVELIFAAGTINEPVATLASAANELLDEGTMHHTSAEIAEALDNYGAFFQTECGNDFASVTLYTLSRFLPETMPLLIEIVCEPSYATHEISTFCTQGKQRLAINLEKGDFLARKHFINALYGNKHPYGHFPSVADFDQITSENLKQFHQTNYLNGLFTVVIAGKFNDEQSGQILKTLESAKFKRGKSPIALSGDSEEKKTVHISKKDALQSAIRIGRKMFNRKHPDYFHFSILNTVLGGYFGSRLMANIREDKGYTYGIGSGLISQINDGYFFISTEVGADVAKDAVSEIYKEIERLNNELIPKDELDLVRNYLFGAFQRSIDGPFALADRHKTMALNGLNTGHYHDYLRTLRKASPEDLLETARHHLKVAHLTEVIIGP
jgi:zinc protease